MDEGKDTPQKYIIPIDPRVKRRPVVTFRRGRVITFTPSSGYEGDVKLVLRQYFKRPLIGKLKLTVVFYRSANRGDLDNYLKGFEDAGNGVIWQDDKQILDIRARLSLDKEEPRTEFCVEEFVDGQDVFMKTSITNG